MASQLEDYLTRVGGFLERAEAALGRLSHVPAMLKTTSMTCHLGEVSYSSMEDGQVELYGCFSPRVGDAQSSLSVPSTVEGKAIDDVVAHVLQIMPKLQELAASPDLPLIVEHVKVDVPATLSFPVQSDVAPTSIPPSPPHRPDALVAEEIYGLLSRLDVLILELRRSIGCLLTGTPIKKKIKKVGDGLQTGIRKEKSLRYNKSVNIGKKSAAT
jgi:hypothetical protein